MPESADPRPAGEPIPLAVVYGGRGPDRWWTRRRGWWSNPAPGNPDGTLVNALIAHCGASLSGVGGVRRPGIVHRLDKETSGLMVAAKNDRSHAALAAQFKARSIDRAYTAFAWGAPARPSGEIEGNIGRSARNRKKMAVLARGGRPALTRYRTVTRLGEAASRLECRLATGRTHQIRRASRLARPAGDRRFGLWRRADGRAAARAPAPAGRRPWPRSGAMRCTPTGSDFATPRAARRVSFESDLPNELNLLENVLKERW